jgi:hypothetical protein
LDKINEKIAALQAATSQYLKKGREFIATAFGKAAVAVLLALAIAGYAHHRGVVSTLDRLSMQEPAFCPAAEPAPAPVVEDDEGKRRVSDLADQLRASEQAKEKLKKKVEDYEKRLEKRGKGRDFTLSPADARGLSNIR